MTQDSFMILKIYIEGNLGIKIPESKKIMLESRLAKRLRILDISDYEEYCKFVFSPEGLKNEIHRLIDAVTTNETSFFRESGHFDLLTRKILPEFNARQQPGTLNLWSVAAATGQEAYTLAMVIEDFIKAHPNISYRILATDISETALNIAETGIYTTNQAQQIPKRNQFDYCLKSRDPQQETIRFKPSIREKIMFRKLNLMDSDFRIGKTYQLVFCRNVFIYFDRPTQARVLGNIYSHLAPGGYLFMGHAENLNGTGLDLEKIAAAAYRKPLGGNT